jgi:hypothetical protein
VDKRMAAVYSSLPETEMPALPIAMKANILVMNHTDKAQSGDAFPSFEFLAALSSPFPAGVTAASSSAHFIEELRLVREN